jgi:hypothetical protein
MNDFTTNNVTPSSIRENLLIDGSECSLEECNSTNCNYISNEDGDGGNYGKIHFHPHSLNYIIMNGIEHRRFSNLISFYIFTVSYDDQCLENEFSERCNLNDSALDNHHHQQDQCNSNDCNECPDEYSNECQNLYQDIDYTDQYYNDDATGQQSQTQQQQHINYTTENNRGPEILYKSSKQLYKAVARQCGIQCKMTDTCRYVLCLFLTLIPFVNLSFFSFFSILFSLNVLSSLSL